MGRIAYYALKFSPTVFVGVILILFLGITSILKSPVDCCPHHRHSDRQRHRALELERKITTVPEASLSVAVKDIRAIQSSSDDGMMASIRCFLRPLAGVGVFIPVDFSPAARSDGRRAQLEGTGKGKGS